MTGAIRAGIAALTWLLVCSGVWAASFDSTYLFNTPTDTPTLPNASFSSFTRVGLAPATQAGAFASSGWSDGTTRDASQFVQFTLTPAAGYSLKMDTLSFDLWSKNSAGGPTAGMAEILLAGTVMSSVNYGITATSTSVLFSLGGFSGLDGQGITVRFYGWGSINKNQGELSFDNVRIMGELNPVPEPVNMALAAFGGCVFGIGACRKLRIFRKLADEN